MKHHRSTPSTTHQQPKNKQKNKKPTKQSWGDEDIPPLLEALSERVAQGVHVLSSWEKYRNEVLGGRLEWSPMHTSDAFWRANVDKFEDKDFQVLRVLLKLLEASREVSRSVGSLFGTVRLFVAWLLRAACCVLRPPTTTTTKH